MKIYAKISLLVIAISVSLLACNQTAPVRQVAKEREILQIQSDGQMVFKDRVMPTEDVIIYPDGYGGEKAAVKLYSPYHRPFYRDSIVVERPVVKN